MTLLKQYKKQCNNSIKILEQLLSECIYGIECIAEEEKLKERGITRACPQSIREINREEQRQKVIAIACNFISAARRANIKKSTNTFLKEKLTEHIANLEVIISGFKLIEEEFLEKESLATPPDSSEESYDSFEEFQEKTYVPHIYTRLLPKSSIPMEKLNFLKKMLDISTTEDDILVITPERCFNAILICLENLLKLTKYFPDKKNTIFSVLNKCVVYGDAICRRLKIRPSPLLALTEKLLVSKCPVAQEDSENSQILKLFDRFISTRMPFLLEIKTRITSDMAEEKEHKRIKSSKLVEHEEKLEQIKKIFQWLYNRASAPAFSDFNTESESDLDEDKWREDLKEFDKLLNSFVFYSDAMEKDEKEIKDIVEALKTLREKSNLLQQKSHEIQLTPLLIEIVPIKVGISVFDVALPQFCLDLFRYLKKRELILQQQYRHRAVCFFRYQWEDEYSEELRKNFSIAENALEQFERKKTEAEYLFKALYNSIIHKLPYKNLESICLSLAEIFYSVIHFETDDLVQEAQRVNKAMIQLKQYYLQEQSEEESYSMENVFVASDHASTILTSSSMSFDGTASSSSSFFSGELEYREQLSILDPIVDIDEVVHKIEETESQHGAEAALEIISQFRKSHFRLDETAKRTLAYTVESLRTKLPHLSFRTYG